MNTPTLGLDISLRTFVAALWFGPKQCLRQELENTPLGFRRLSRWLQSHGCAGALRVGVEATNTYADKVVEWLHGAGHTVFLLNPERTACYARCLGQRNKTDPADAATIAAYVAVHEGRHGSRPHPSRRRCANSLALASN